LSKEFCFDGRNGALAVWVYQEVAFQAFRLSVRVRAFGDLKNAEVHLIVSPADGARLRVGNFEYEVRVFHLGVGSGAPLVAPAVATKVQPPSAGRRPTKQNVPPKVSIVILNYRRPVMTKLALWSTQRVTLPHEVILIENGTPRELQTPHPRTARWRVHKLADNLGFSGGNNFGANIANGEYLLFLNNDAILTEGAVEEMVEAAKELGPDAIVGPTFRYPDGLLQEVGGFVDCLGKTYQRGKFDRSFNFDDLPRFDHVHYVSAACLLVSRKLYNDLDGFDNIYKDVGYYDDVDFCLRAKEAGANILVARNSLCFHFENATNCDLPQTDSAHGLFMARWRLKLASEVGV
jgi:GT2 family glycosyltransferase